MFLYGCVVPSFLHRAHKRCTLLGDTYHHVQFLRTILEHRQQNMQVVKSKMKAYFCKQRRLRKLSRPKRLKNPGRVISIKFDLVSKLHLFTRTCILASYKAAGVLKPRIIYSSLPKVMSRFYTKFLEKSERRWKVDQNMKS